MNIRIIEEDELSEETRVLLRTNRAIEDATRISHGYSQNISEKIKAFRLYFQGFLDAIQVYEFIGAKPSEKILLINRMLKNEKLTDYDIWYKLATDIGLVSHAEDLQDAISNKMISGKIEKAVELICSLYRKDLINDAYIVGSMVKKTAKEESDIDILIINPVLYTSSEISPIPVVIPDSQSKKEEKIAQSLRSEITYTLKDIGVEFKQIYRRHNLLWYQLYKGEIFHIMPQRHFEEHEPHMRITRDMCS